VKRITPDEVKAAYAKTGIKPERGGYFSSKKGRPACGCGIAALYIANCGLTSNPELDLWDWCEPLFGRHYSQGFTIGFDGGPRWLYGRIDGEEFEAGIEDGNAAAIAVGLRERPSD
jgi:hypothetical protein